MIAIALSAGASSAMAQGLTPGYIPASPYYAADASYTTDASLDARMSMLEDAMKKKVDTVDTKKGWSSPKLAGRMFFESYSMNQSEEPAYFNKVGLRELRLTLTGNGYEAFDYKAEINFQNANAIGVNDLWIGAKNIPGLGYFRVGNHYVETGMGIITGTTTTTLTDVQAPAGAFGFSRRLGMSSQNLFAHDRIRLFSGIYQGNNISGNPHFIDYDDYATKRGTIFNTRLTAAPYYADNGRHVLHVGGHYTYMTTPQGVTMRSGGHSWVGGNSIWTNPIEGDHFRAGLELMYQSGPLGIRSEAFLAQYGAKDGNGQARGASAELAYFLTGEHREYSLATGMFGAAKVKRNFHPFKCGEWNLVDGFGAWQVAAQYSYVDLGDWIEDNGGYQNDWTFGLNWFWTPNIRWVFAYTHSHQDKSNGPSYQDIFGVSARVQW